LEKFAFCVFNNDFFSCAFCCVLRAYFPCFFVPPGAVCVVDLSDIDNIGDCQYGESYNIGKKQYASKNCKIYRFLESVTPLGFARYVQNRRNRVYSAICQHPLSHCKNLAMHLSASAYILWPKREPVRLHLVVSVWVRSTPSNRLYTASTSRCIFSASLREA